MVYVVTAGNVKGFPTASSVYFWLVDGEEPFTGRKKSPGKIFPIWSFYYILINSIRYQ